MEVNTSEVREYAGWKTRTTKAFLELQSLQNMKVVEAMLILQLKALSMTCWRFIAQKTENKTSLTGRNACQGLWRLTKVQRDNEGKQKTLQYYLGS